MTAANAAAAQNGPVPQPQRPGRGGTDPGPRNLMRDRQNPDLLVPPSTDHGTLPNLRFSFSDSHVRLEPGGWTRQVTVRELGVSRNIAGVNMRLNAGGVRELHWHKAAEWAYMLYGTARITAIDAQGRYFVDDVGVGDLWYFASGIPHSIQGLGPDGCEFLLVFDDGDFDEDNTFLLSDWFKHTPNDVLAKNFGVSIRCSGTRPTRASSTSSRRRCRARWLRPVSGLTADAAAAEPPDDGAAADPVKKRHGPHHRHQRVSRLQDDLGGAGRGRAGGTARATLASQHRRMAVLHRGTGAHGRVRRVGPGPHLRFPWPATSASSVAMGHYVENTGTTPLRFLEIFKSDYYADVSLNQWMALTPPELVNAHLKLGPQFMASLRKNKVPVVPA